MDLPLSILTAEIVSAPSYLSPNEPYERRLLFLPRPVLAALRLAPGGWAHAFLAVAPLDTAAAQTAAADVDARPDSGSAGAVPGSAMAVQVYPILSDSSVASADAGADSALTALTDAGALSSVAAVSCDMLFSRLAPSVVADFAAYGLSLSPSDSSANNCPSAAPATGTDGTAVQMSPLLGGFILLLLQYLHSSLLLCPPLLSVL